MQELYAKLRENGIDVYIMTAAHEEIIRMVASDPSTDTTSILKRSSA